jgi:ribonuclease HI
MSELSIHTDGGARGNPGPAGIGVHLQVGDFEMRHGRVIGEATNNVAEYSAVIEAITLIENIIIGGTPHISSLHFYLDSELVVKQLTGVYRIKEPSLQVLAQKILVALKALNLPYTFSHVRRNFNKVADSLVNDALDGKLQPHVQTS